MGMFYVRGENIRNIEVYNLQGQIIRNITGSKINMIDLDQEPKGFYLLKIRQRDKYLVKKIVLE